MLRQICLLALLPLALHAQQSQFGEWKIDKVPALAPATTPAWDDFAIATASVQRLPNKWTMLYEGISLSEDGGAHAFGVAESADGVKWNKRPDNPVFLPLGHEWEIVTGPSVTKWQDRWIAAFVVNRALTYKEKSVEQFNLPNEWLCLADSNDEVNWGSPNEIKGLPLKPAPEAAPRPCLYSDAGALHLWWIGDDENETPALFHSVSRDAEDWSKPNRQVTSEIDPRPICCARVYPSGDYYILVYVARDDAGGGFRVVTKISKNARTWSATGPPEFALGPHWQHSAPAIGFEKNGARLFYCEPKRPDPTTWLGPRDPVQGAVLRTAFSQKQDDKK